MDEKYIAIGIDFGTTYSGVAFASSTNPDAIEVITNWDAAYGQEKVPTRIAFSAGPPSKQHFGNDIPADLDPLAWFKLLLVDPKNLTDDVRDSPHITRARKRFEDEKRDPMHAVAQYLKLVWRHTLETLEQRFDEAALRYTPFRVYLTVPAIWDETARKLMRQAALRAGICDTRRDAKQTLLALVSEPEAAAVAVFDEYKGQHTVEVGDIFIVCDAGGGTVDLVSYEVISVNPMEVKEFVKGDGGMCGAVFIDEQFENQVRRTLGDRWKRLDAASRKKVFDSEWENGIKRNFDGREGGEWTVALPGSLFTKTDVLFGRRDTKKADLPIPLKNGQLLIRTGHIRQWFQRVIQPTSHLIRTQMAQAKAKGKTPKSLLLVGGFGSCKYLYQRLKEEFGSKGLKVLQPAGPRGWSAISRGAVIRGLSDSGTEFNRRSLISSRVSRVSYGVSASDKFKEGKHDVLDRYWCPVEGEYKARDQMSWYLKVGDEIVDRKPVIFNFYHLLHRPRDMQEIKILRNREDEPPIRKTEKVDSFVTINVPIKAKFEQLEIFEHVETKSEMRVLNYDLEMYTTGTSMEWQVRVDGKLQGQEALDIEEE